MTEHYVSFETAKLLKEKGFNELTAKTNPIFEGKEYKSDLPIPTLQMTLQWLRKKYNLMCVCLPYATIEGIFYVYKIFYLDHKQIGYFTKKEKSGFDDPKSAYEYAIRYCLENLIDN